MNEGEMEKEREREKRMVTRVVEPRTSALFAEFTHYQNTLLVPMVRSGPSGSVVHGRPSLPGERYTRRGNILYDFGFHPRLRSPRISVHETTVPLAKIGNNDYRKREIRRWHHSRSRE